MSINTPYTPYVTAIRSSIWSMTFNSQYISRELANVTMDDGVKTQLLKILENLDGTIYDVRSEVRNLEDELGMHPDRPPRDRNSLNPDPRVTIEMICDLLSDRMPELDSIVRRLEADANESNKMSAYLLVAESANNIYDDHRLVCDALSHIDSSIGEVH